MHRDSSAPAGSDGRSKHWPRRGWLVLAAVAGLAAGVLVGRGLARPASPAPPVGGHPAAAGLT